MNGYSLSSKDFHSLLLAQFLSALGDNAIFVAAIALIKDSYLYPNFWEAILQASFLVAYVVLAPYVGPLADGYSKSRVMMMSNALKFLGALAMLLGMNSLLSYAIIGIGAAAYGPAKYGILTEMFPEVTLVRANAYLEGSTIAAILLGVSLAGKLADVSLPALFWLCVVLYFFAGVVNFYIPKITPPSTFSFLKFSEYTKIFWGRFLSFVSLPPAQFSLMGTTTFWSVGTSLRLILFAWIPFMFLKTSNTLPAALMGVLSIGIVLGALMAGKWIHLDHIRRVLWPGFALGFFILCVVFVHKIWILFILMVLMGISGGMFAVPLNALLQSTGKKTVGPGVALSFQNFCENGGMLVFTLVYSLLLHMQLPLPSIVLTLGIIIFVVFAFLRVKKL